MSTNGTKRKKLTDNLAIFSQVVGSFVPTKIVNFLPLELIPVQSGKPGRCLRLGAIPAVLEVVSREWYGK